MNLILTGVLFGCFYWILESVRDVLVFERGSLLERLFSPDPMSFWTRFLVVCIIILYSVYIYSLQEKTKNKPGKETRGFLDSRGIIWSGIGFGVLYWVIEAFRDAVIFHQGNVIEEIFSPNSIRFWMRILPVAIIVLFSIYTIDLINQYKKETEKVKSSLKEKEVLLREIHHRVKNNLQVISSLLSLQSQYVKDKDALQMFKETQDRVYSMALAHEKLYQSENLAEINCRDYIKRLADGLYHSYGVSPKDIELEMDVKNISLNIDRAIPCGLVINELISNALKHAFPSHWSEKKKIKISVNQKKNGKIILIVKDNGIGIPKELDFRKTKSLGLQLVIALAEEQLGGKIILNRKEGTEFRISLMGEVS